MSSIASRKDRLIRRFIIGDISEIGFENAMFELERLPQGLAECPDCGMDSMHFHDHIGGWKCTNCGDVRKTGSVVVLQYPEGW